MLKRLVTILVAVTLTTLAGVSPAAAYEGETYEELIEDQTLNDQHAIIIRFYSAVFGRTPDNDGVRFWLDQYDTGEWSTRRIANFFATSDEFKGLYGENTTNAEFVDSVYPNVLGRAPDAAGERFWNGYLADGNSRAEMILLISNAPEFVNANWLPFEAAASACGLEVVVATDEDPVPIDGNDVLVDQLVTITTTPSASCGPLAGVVGSIAWVGGTTINEGTLAKPYSIAEQPRTQNWKCFDGQEARIAWSIRSVETVNGEQALGVASSGSTTITCTVPAPPPPPAECSITPSVTLVSTRNIGDVVLLGLSAEVEVSGCDFDTIRSSVDGFSGAPFDRLSSDSPHLVANPNLTCGEVGSYTVSVFDNASVQIGESFRFTAAANDFEPCQHPE